MIETWRPVKPAQQGRVRFVIDVQERERGHLESGTESNRAFLFAPWMLAREETYGGIDMYHIDYPLVPISMGRSFIFFRMHWLAIGV